MPDYETSLFDPPAPVARVVLRNPNTGTSIADVLLLLDTGSDITLHAPCLNSSTWCIPTG